jgi:hypothetical protein
MSGGGIRDTGGREAFLSHYVPSMGDALSNSASPASAILVHAFLGRTEFITLLHCYIKAEGDPTEPGSFYSDPGFSQHVLADSLDFYLKH